MRTLTQLLYIEHMNTEETGVISDRAKFLIKAFNLVEFGQCPVCDNRGITRYDKPYPCDIQIKFECQTCHAYAHISPKEIMNLEDVTVAFTLLVTKKMVESYENPTG